MQSSRQFIADIKRCANLPYCSKPSERLGCIHPPLLEIEPHLIIVNELHLILWISDRLIDDLVVRAAELERPLHKNRHHK